VVLQSLSPSYNEFVKSYLMNGYDDITFHQWIMKLRHLKVEPIAGKVIDPTSIFDIQCYKCFINTYCSFEYMILIPIFWKQDLQSEVLVEEMVIAHGDDMLDVDDWCQSASTFIFMLRI
jgi:hypothetical protein